MIHCWNQLWTRGIRVTQNSTGNAVDQITCGVSILLWVGKIFTPLGKILGVYQKRRGKSTVQREGKIVHREVNGRERGRRKEKRGRGTILRERGGKERWRGWEGEVHQRKRRERKGFWGRKDFTKVLGRIMLREGKEKGDEGKGRLY